MENEITFHTDSGSYNDATKRSQLIHEEKNAVENYHRISELFDKGLSRDISDEPKHTDEPCIIIGSGGSLDKALPLLHKWKGGIICTTSHALTLVKWGAPPTHIFALDPFCRWPEIEGIDWSKYGTKLITTPTVWPDLIANWPNEIILYRQNMGRKDSFYQTTLRHQYSRREGFRAAQFHFMAKTEITLFAASPPAQLFAAQVLGYGNIFLSGCDFGYTFKKDRFTNWTFENGEWKEHVNLYEDLTDDVKNMSIISLNGILMHPVHAYYKKNMVSAWRLSLQDIWTTDRGALTEVPYVDIGHVIWKQGRHIKGIGNEEKKRRSEEYLALVGAFIIEAMNGFSFVEMANPMQDLPGYLRSMNRQYVCTQCKAEMTSDGDTDVTGSECPLCHGKTVARRVYADIDANIKRIKGRIDAAAKFRAKWERKHPNLVRVK